jgi:nucleoside-diphosphate-sugar epimerase
MKTLVFGASGATGKLVVSQLLERNLSARIVVREAAVIPVKITENKNIEIVKGNVDDLDTDQIHKLMTDCDSVICCLGHNISFKGIFGKPHNLVVNAVKKITGASSSSEKAKKFILMSTTAYTNKKTREKDSSGEKLIFSLLEIVLPPHKDNIGAADHLVYGSGASDMLEWVAVRPDSLFDEENKSDYEICESKTRSPIFNSGKTSRINVSHFMAELLTNDNLWQKWKCKTPVIYNKE